MLDAPVVGFEQVVSETGEPLAIPFNAAPVPPKTLPVLMNSEVPFGHLLGVLPAFVESENVVVPVPCQVIVPATVLPVPSFLKLTTADPLPPVAVGFVQAVSVNVAVNFLMLTTDFGLLHVAGGAAAVAVPANGTASNEPAASATAIKPFGPVRRIDSPSDRFRHGSLVWVVSHRTLAAATQSPAWKPRHCRRAPGTVARTDSSSSKPRRVTASASARSRPRKALEPGELVFPSPLGGTVPASQFRHRVWSPACVAAGLGEVLKIDGKDHYDGLRLHDLRHSAVALWIAAGASPKEIATRAATRL